MKRCAEERHADFIAGDAENFQQNEENHGCCHLKDELLDDGQTQIPLFGQLFIVVQEADQRAGNGEKQNAQNRRQLVAQLPHKPRRRQNHGRDKNQAAHNRGPLFGHMPVRPDFFDRLPKLCTAQNRNQPQPHQNADHKRRGARHGNPKVLH